jgi:phosphatidylserine/phosphatidylglycerophosphate/cardiolipin synthase-like enzyme
MDAQVIKVYFNQSVDNTISSITDAKTSSHLDDTICALIDESNITLDIAVWDNGSTKIITALNNAYLRGVQVRYISSTNSLNSALSGLNSNIPLLKRNAGLTTNVMHNKFIIVDNTKILSGSMNFGNGSIFDDYNNIVIISNSSLAQAYTTEFNEMWGSSGAQPNTSNSKFGPDKSDNTTHLFTLGTSSVESYFSPTDGTTAKIINAINSADFTLDVALFTFTNNDLGDAVIAAKNRGVAVRCIMENENYIGSEYSKLVNAGIPVISHANITNDFHHKYCIIDAQQVSSDPIVISGSHNWSNSAEEEYDENTLIIHDEIIANQYLEEFSKRFSSLSLGINKLDRHNKLGWLYPNPNQGNFKISAQFNTIDALIVTNAIGQVVFKLSNSDINQEFSLNLDKGLYEVTLTSNHNTYHQKLIIQ